MITVSTVTPVYCGEKYLTNLVTAINEVKQKWAEQEAPMQLQEAIFVVDSAIDDSLSVLESLTEQYDWVKVINLSRNYGQHAATVAGICHSYTDWIVTLDEDLQHKPQVIETLLREQAQTGADVVYAQPKSKVHGGSWRDFSSSFTKSVLARITATPQIKLFNSFRLIRGNIARAAASASSSQTYLDIALTWFTNAFKAKEIEMQDDRYIESQSSGYSLIKLIRHARKLVASSNVDVTSAGLLIGFVTISLAILIGVWTIVQRLFFPETVGLVGWASTVSLITFFGGVTISLICIALEYINIITVNQLGKPTFFTIDRQSDRELHDWFSERD